MSFNSSSVPHAWVPILPRTSDAAPPPPLLSDDRPSNVAGIRPHYFVFGAGQELPAPAILPVPAPEAVPEVTEAVEVERPAKRRRLLAAAPARVGTRVDDLAPVPIPRTVRAPTRTSGRRSTKADKACARCRQDHKGCVVQNSRSKCVSCEHLRVPCEFKPTPKQVEVAQKKATQDADPFVGYPGPVETAPARERNSRGPRRTILPRPQAPAPGYASSTAGSEVQPQYPEQPDSSFGGIATGSQALPESPDGYNGGFGGFTAGPDAQYPRLLDMGFGGLDQRSKRSSQRPQEPSAGYGGFDPRVNEYWQRRRAPESAFEESYNRPYASPHLGTQQDDFTQWSQQPAPEYGGHSNTTIGDSSVLGGYPPTPRGHPSAFGEPNFAFGGSPVGTSPYAIDPAVGFRGPPPPYGDLPRPPEWRRTRRE